MELLCLLGKLRAMESLRAEHQSILECELFRAEELRQKKKKSEEKPCGWSPNSRQPAETEQQMDPLESAPATVHNPSTGYSVAVEENTDLATSLLVRNVEQEPLQTIPQSLYTSRR